MATPLTFRPCPVKHVYVHEIVQVGSHGLATQAVVLAGRQDAVLLPVRPVYMVIIQGQTKRVRQFLTHQHLEGEVSGNRKSFMPDKCAT